MKARSVDVSLYEKGDGEIQIWGVTFTLPGTLPRVNGKIPEGSRRKIEKKIKKILEEVDFSNIKDD